jgi:hypothetical protein
MSLDDPVLVEIILERPNATFQAGERVRGLLRLHAREACTSRAILIDAYWRTSGYGNEATMKRERKRIEIQHLAQGATLDVPFELELPLGPVSYDGKLIKVEWLIEMSVDVPWARDPRYEYPITVTAAEPRAFEQTSGYRDAARLVPVRHSLGPRVAQGKRVRITPLGIGIGFAAAGLLFATGALPAQIFSGLLGLVTSVGLVQLTQRRLASGRLGNPLVQVVPPEATAGQQVTARVLVTPTRPVTLRRAEAELKGQEISTTGTGSSSHTEHFDLHRETQLMHGERILRAGAATTFEATFTLPAGSAPSFGAPSNEVTWTVKLLIAVEDGLDWEEEHVLTVIPA